jgi:hypothetical protein
LAKGLREVLVALSCLCYKNIRILPDEWMVKMKRIKRGMVIGGVGLCLAILIGIQSPELAWSQGSGGASSIQSYMKPKPVPDFSLEDLAGKMVDIRQYRGKVVLLNFWATW